MNSTEKTYIYALKKQNGFSSMLRVLISDDVHPLLINGLQAKGYACDYLPNISDLEVRACIETYTGLIINSKIRVDADMLNRGSELRFVGRLGSGLEIVDLDYARRRGVAIYNSPQGNCDAVAEHALGMLLAWSNHLPRADRQVRQRIWQREANRGMELMHKTIGIYGCGHTGSALGRRLRGWSMQVLVYDKYRTQYPPELDHCRLVPEETLFEECDILSLHLPLTDETRHLVDADFLARFSKPIVLVNTSRGAVVKTEDMLAALQNGRLRGACLDVFENEKPETYTEDENRLYDRLYALENVLVSPHVAGWTAESKVKLAQLLLDQIPQARTKADEKG